MATLVLAEVHGSKLNEATAKALTAAAEIGQPVHILVAGENVKGAAEEAAKLAGVEKVHLAEGPEYAHQLAEPVAALLAKMAEHHPVIVAPATSAAKNIMPRVAALLDVMQISEISKVVSPDTFERPIYAGNAVQTVQTSDAKKVITVRTSAFKATGEGGSAAIEPVSAAETAFSTAALPPSPVAAKVEVRTVMTFLASFDLTVWIALPA